MARRARGAGPARPAAVRGRCPTRASGVEDRHALDLVKNRRDAGLPGAQQDRPADKDKGGLLPLIEQYRAAARFRRLHSRFPRKTGEGLDVLRKAIVERLPEGPAYFPADHITDQPERFLAAELIREKMLRRNARRRCRTRWP